MLIAIVAIIFVLFTLMEFAAVALKLTGLDIDQARFQALSAVTGTGFTTREAEIVLAHPTRRKIVMGLMIVGNAGLITLIITAVSTIQREVPWYHLVLALVLLIILVRLITSKILLRKIDEKVEKTLARQMNIRRKPVEEVLRLDARYGIAETIIEEDCPLVGKTLQEADFREKDILVLAIERNGKINHTPGADDILKADDKLIVYGVIKNLHSCLN